MVEVRINVLFVQRIVFLIAFGLCLGCNPKHSVPNEQGVELEFQVVKIDLGEKTLFSNRAETFASSAEELRNTTPQAGFSLLERKDLKLGSADLDEQFVFGRLKGALYSVDTFEVLKSKTVDSSTTVWVVYTKRESNNGEPAPAFAFYKARLPISIKKLKINFIQCDDLFRPLSNVYFEQAETK